MYQTHIIKQINMNTYTVILQFSKIFLSSDIQKEHLLNIIQYNNFKIDYIGGELDNQADYIDEETEKEQMKYSYFTIHFDLPAEKVVDFELNNEELVSILSEVISKNELKDVRNDGKDATIYIY